MNVDGRVVRVCAMALGKERQWTKSQQEGATTRAQKELVDRRASAAIAAGECNGLLTKERLGWEVGAE